MVEQIELLPLLSPPQKPKSEEILGQLEGRNPDQGFFLPGRGKGIF
jgi:hypothetical protein